MADRMDDVARMIAAGDQVPRRKLLRGFAALLGGGLFGAVSGRAPAGAAPPVKCQAGTTLCGDLCRDTSINPDHCGACGAACPAGQMCRNGACVACTCEPACPVGQIRCNGVCVNSQSSSANCGTCGHVCPSGQTCVSGVCQQCPGAMCNGTCVDLATDVRNCGGCGVVCPSNASCGNGTCTCPPETQMCGSDCVSSIGQSCDTGVPGICAAGILRCVNGTVTCVQVNQPRPETCNGQDDNCNGLVDDGNPGGGQPCNTGLPGACAAGTTNCISGAIVCTAPAGC